jgi:hypothetical protein
MKSTNNNKEEKGGSIGKALAISAGVAALAAGAYFFFGPNSKENQKKAKGWMVKMKGEIMEKMESAKEITEPIYRQIVDSVAQKYSEAQAGSKKEVQSMARELKAHWKDISKSAATKAKRTSGKTRKTASKPKRTRKNG